MLAHLLGQKPIHLHGHVSGGRVRGRPRARQSTRRATHMQRTETILRTPHGAHNRAHVLHVLKLQVGRIRRIHRRRLNPVQKQRRARTIPTDTRRPGIRLEGDVA